MKNVKQRLEKESFLKKLETKKKRELKKFNINDNIDRELAITKLKRLEKNMEVKDIVEFMINNDISPKMIELQPHDEITARYNAIKNFGYKSFEEYSFGRGSTTGQR